MTSLSISSSLQVQRNIQSSISVDNASHASRTPGAVMATCVIFVAFVALVRNPGAAVDDFGDSSAYMSAGIFALLGMGIALLMRRNCCTLLAAILIAALVGGLYAIPLTRHLGSPTRNHLVESIFLIP